MLLFLRRSSVLLLLGIAASGFGCYSVAIDGTGSGKGGGLGGNGGSTDTSSTSETLSCTPQDPVCPFQGYGDNPDFPYATDWPSCDPWDSGTVTVDCGSAEDPVLTDIPATGYVICMHVPQEMVASDQVLYIGGGFNVVPLDSAPDCWDGLYGNHYLHCPPKKIGDNTHVCAMGPVAGDVDFKDWTLIYKVNPDGTFVQDASGNKQITPLCDLDEVNPPHCVGSLRIFRDGKLVASFEDGNPDNTCEYAKQDGNSTNWYTPLCHIKSAL